MIQQNFCPWLDFSLNQRDNPKLLVEVEAVEEAEVAVVAVVEPVAFVEGVLLEGAEGLLEGVVVVVVSGVEGDLREAFSFYPFSALLYMLSVQDVWGTEQA